jgi:hypothetical protein
MSAPTIDICIPTVSGRELWLEECLHSVKELQKLFDHQQIRIVVSGNGTNPVSENFNTHPGVEFAYRPIKLPITDHLRLIISESRAEYIWIVGDDDFLNLKGAEKIIRDLISFNGELDLAIGKIRFFNRSSNSNPYEALPLNLNDNNDISLEELSKITKGDLYWGSYIVKISTLNLNKLDRYKGTSHEIFGAIWDSIVDKPDAHIYTTSETVMNLRQEEKAWDYSDLRITLGKLDYLDLLPAQVRRYLPEPPPKYTTKQVLSLLAHCSPNEFPLLRNLLDRRGVKHPKITNILMFIPLIVWRFVGILWSAAKKVIR